MSTVFGWVALINLAAKAADWFSDWFSETKDLEFDIQVTLACQWRCLLMPVTLPAFKLKPQGWDNYTLV